MNNPISHEESMKALDYIGAKIDSLQEVNKELVEALKQAYADLKSLSTGGPSFHDRTLPQIEQVLLKAGGQMNNQATPRPWKLFQPDRPLNEFIKVCTEMSKDQMVFEARIITNMDDANDHNYRVLAVLGNGPKADANARLIVKSVNCHDELVDIIKTILGQIEEGLPFHCTENNRKLLEQALSKAQEFNND